MHTTPGTPWQTPRLTPLSRTEGAAGGADPNVTEDGHLVAIVPSSTIPATGPYS